MRILQAHSYQMEKSFTRKCSSQVLWFVFPVILVFCIFLLRIDYSCVMCSKFDIKALANNYVTAFLSNKNNTPKVSLDLCLGRYIYMHNLPSQFNDDVVKRCNFTAPGTNKFPMCKYTANSGYGPQVENSSQVLSDESWFATNQFLLEVIFHNRMKTYECLTSNSSIASAIFVPYYLGLDIMPYLWGNFHISLKDQPGFNLLKWVAERPEWKRMWGRDHFLIGGRIATDFRRESDRKGAWGSKFRFFPESNNITMLAIEASPWNNDLAIPYPTSFHPSEDSEVLEWQERMRRQKRPYLFSFSGAPRPNMKTSIRSILIDQCRASSSTCKLLDCREGVTNCDNPIHVMKLYQSSVFCLQPPGDSLTRRSTFESILSGCIPVFFHPGSAYLQYTWHLPKNYTIYSVFIPEKNLWSKEFRVNETLIQFSKDQVAAMREEVIRLIPRIIYSDPRRVRKDENVEDAFDLAVKGILERIEAFRGAIREGKDPSIGFADRNDSKFIM